jgi:pyrroloquinoline quinone biosynthesis protein E
MQEPCRSCERKTRDFGGCRCQAMMYTGDPDATDPVCSLSPKRGLIDAVIAQESAAPQWVYRINPSNVPVPH